MAKNYADLLFYLLAMVTEKSQRLTMVWPCSFLEPVKQFELNLAIMIFGRLSTKCMFHRATSNIFWLP